MLFTVILIDKFFNPNGQRIGCLLGFKKKITCAIDRKSTRLNSSHSQISYAVFCLKKKKIITVSRVRVASDNASYDIARSGHSLVRYARARLLARKRWSKRHADSQTWLG